MLGGWWKKWCEKEKMDIGKLFLLVFLVAKVAKLVIKSRLGKRMHQLVKSFFPAGSYP